MPAERRHPTVLISYSHDSPEHERGVLDVCNRLRSLGVDALVDQFLPGAPSEGWPLWMERQIEQRDFTLIVCTEAYRRRFMEDEAAGVGRGVIWEARILRNLLYEDSERHARIIPIVFESAARAFVPTVFRGHFYDLSDDRGFEALLRHLFAEPGAAAQALGALGPQGSRWSAFERPWLVPDILRTRFFTGRHELLEKIRAGLVQHHRVALSGLGGVGKTQTAIEYAVRHRADYPDGVFWVNAESASALNSGFVEIAKALRLSAAASNDQDQIVRAVLDWLNGTGSWLLLFDNVDDRRAVIPFVPQRGEGDILITSRETVFQELGIARGVDVVDLERTDAVAFLLARTARDEQEKGVAAELAHELGDLPLALEQAAAYIAETNAGFADYLASYRKRRMALLEKSKGLVAHETVAATWSENFTAVEAISPPAAEVLRLAAFVAADEIPFELLQKGAGALGGAISKVLSDPDDDLAVAELLRPLVRYSLVRSDPQSRTFAVHRLVQETIRKMLGAPETAGLVRRAIAALNMAFPEVEYETWTRCDRLVPHVAAVDRWAGEHEIQTVELANVLNRAAFTLYERGRYADAQRLYERTLAVRESELGDRHADVAATLNHLATMHKHQGHFAQAVALHERALKIAETLGAVHPEMGKTLNNLAIAYNEQGLLREAEPLYERAVAVFEQSFGPDHMNVARALNNLAASLSEQGKFAEAKPLHERALAIRRKALKPDHPDVATSLYNLANVESEQGDYAAARVLYDQALAMFESVLGSSHPFVAEPLEGLGALSRRQRRFDDAEKHFSRALHIWQQSLGEDHPSVARALIGLGDTHRRMSRFEDARALIERGLEMRVRAFGPEHLRVAEARHAHAMLLADLERDEEAIQSLEQALRIWDSSVWEYHPDRARALFALAALYRRRGRLDDARQALSGAARIRQAVFVADFPEPSELREAPTGAKDPMRDGSR